MSKDKRVTITPRKLQEIKTEAIGQTFLLVAAYLMDELNYEEDKILELWDGVSRYSDAIKNKDITMYKVCKILEEHTGMKVRWNA
jgi:hypothetical protein